jgi:hypothetical protein
MSLTYHTVGAVTVSSNTEVALEFQQTLRAAPAMTTVWHVKNCTFSSPFLLFYFLLLLLFFFFDPFFFCLGADQQIYFCTYTIDVPSGATYLGRLFGIY